MRGSPRPRLVALAAGVVSMGIALGAADTTPPELKALAFTPTTIDTSGSAVEVTLGFAVADDASGVSYIEAAFTDPSGASRRATSARFVPTLSGSLLAKVTFPRFSAPGAWILDNVFLSDAAGNTVLLDTEALARLGVSTRLEVRSAQDHTSPKLSRLEFKPSRINTSMEPADVKVSFEATDDLAGVSHVELVFISPSGVHRQGRPSKFEVARSLSSAMTLTFPRRSEAGQWTLQTVFLADAAGNTQILNSEELSGMGFHTALEVISSEDTEPPRLTSLRLTPDTIDTTAGPATLEVGFRAEDTLSGVTSLEVVLESPSGGAKQRVSATFPSLNGVGDSVKVTFPRLSEPGQWTLSGVLVADAAGNTLSLDTDGLAGIGVRTGLNVRSAQDTAAPNLAALGFAPRAIDTSRGPAEVQVTFRATDNYSGVKSVELNFVSPSESVRIPGAAELAPAGEANGTIRLFFPQSSEPGTWRMETLAVTDAAGNTLVLDADALASRVGGLRVR